MLAAALCGALTGAVAGCLATFAVRAWLNRRFPLRRVTSTEASWTEKPIFRGRQ